MVSLQIQWQLIHHCKECSGTRWCRHEIHTTSHDITLQPASTGRVSTNTIKTPKPLPHPGHSPQHRPLAAPAKHKENCHVTVANAKSASQNMTCWCLWCNTGSSFFVLFLFLFSLLFLLLRLWSPLSHLLWSSSALTVGAYPSCSCGTFMHVIDRTQPFCNTFLTTSAAHGGTTVRFFKDMFPHFFLWSESALPWVHVSSMHCIVELVVATWLCNVLFHLSPSKTLILLSRLPSSRSLCNETFDWPF